MRTARGITLVVDGRTIAEISSVDLKNNVYTITTRQPHIERTIPVAEHRETATQHVVWPSSLRYFADPDSPDAQG
jgi:hypothetical protein